MATKDDGKVDVFWTSHKDSKRVGSVESLATGEAQHAIRSGLARVATDKDKRSAASKKAAATRSAQSDDDKPAAKSDKK